MLFKEYQMAIYSRWGEEVHLIAFCGRHKPHWAANELCVLKGEYVEDKETRYFTYSSLKADGGINEIEEVVKDLPEIKLEGKELRKAMQDIE